MTALTSVAGWTLVHFVWQGLIIAAAAALGLRLLRGASPRARYALACAGLAAMLLSPVATAWRLATGDTAVPPLQRAFFIRAVPPNPGEGDTLRFFRVERRHVVPGGRAADADRGDAASLGLVSMPALVAVWLGGVCLLLVRLAGGVRRVGRLHREARALAPSAWQDVAEQLAHRLGLRRVPRVVDAPFVDGPVVVGWLRPVVLMPIAALAGLTPAQVEAILAHEIAHVRRHDAVVNTCQTVAETLLFYHPAVWWISARIRVEREHCCDDIALDVTGDAVGYASALAELEGWRTGHPSLAMAATGGALLARVARLLGRPARPARGGAVITVTLVVLFVVVAGALQYLVARQPIDGPAVLPDSGSSARAWRMVFDHPSGQMLIRGFTARDLVRYAYQLPMSQIVGGPAWMDTDGFELTTSVDHIPTADETPGLVRDLLEERFGLRTREGTTPVPVLALEIARPDGALGPNLQPATAECFDQQAWIASGRPAGRLAHGQATVFCGEWDEGVAYQRVRSVTMADFASTMRHRLSPGLGRDVINRTGLDGPFDLSLEYFRPAAAMMAVTPSLRRPLELAGFLSVPRALEEQLGLRLVPSTAPMRAIFIDEMHPPLP